MRKMVGVSLVRAGSIGIALASLVLAGCGAFLTPHARIERAQREMQGGKWRDAAFDLRAVLQKDSHNIQAWLLLAQLSLDSADPIGAQSALNHAIGAGAKRPQVDDLRARTWLATGNAKALLDALAHGTINLPQPNRTVMFARALLATGQANQAISALQPLVASQPGLTEARDLLAESLTQESKFPAALEQLNAAMQRDPKSPEPLLVEGRIFEWLGQFPAAERSLARALARMPAAEPIAHRLTALIALTESRLALGEVDAAATSQTALSKLEPLAPETLVLDARINLARGKLQAGTDELERVVVHSPDFVQARMLLGAAFLQRGDMQQAQQQLQRVVEQTPDNIQARKLLAEVQLKLGQPDAALSVLTPALSARTLDPQLLSLVGDAASRTGNSQALIQALERSAREHPHDPHAAVNLAAVYLSTGQSEQALALLEKTPDQGDLRRDQLLVAALLATRGPSAAGKAVDQLLAAHPHDAGVLNLAAAYSVSQNQLDRARAQLRDALANRPDDVTSLITLARVEQAAGDPAAAQRRLSAALAAHPDVLAIRFALADALARTRAFAQARSVLEAAKAARTEPAVQFELARVALAQGDMNQANTALDQAIAVRPSDAAVIEEAGMLLLQANQYDAALARFARAAALAPGNDAYWLNSARAQLALNQSPAARASLEKAAQLHPHWLPVVSALALIDLRQGNGHAALSRVDALLADQPRDPGALELKGDVEAAVGQPAAAVAAYTDAQQLRPSAPLAVKLYSAELASHAVNPAQPLEQWLEHEPNDWRVRDVLGNYWLAVHSPQQAVAQFKLVIAAAPEDVLALNNLAWAMSQIGDPHAQSLAERAYRLAPKAAAVNDTLGWILVRRGQNAAALTYVERAVQLDPKAPELEYHYAYALAKTGQPAQARAILSRILSSPKPFDSRREAQRLLASIRT